MRLTLADDASKSSGSQIGATLGGVAAIIVALSGLYAILHPKPNLPAPSSPPPLNIQPSMPQQADPISTPRPAVHAVVPSRPTGRVPLAFQPDGYWTGTTVRLKKTWVLNLKVEDGEVSGNSTDLFCDFPSIGPKSYPILSGTWDGQTLSFVTDIHEGGGRPSPVRYSLERKGESLVGASTFGSAESIAFHAGKKPCPMPAVPE